jgi:hypothetical protein
VLSQSDWNALAARLSGYVAGVAQSAQFNKGMRQSAAMAAMIGQLINDYGALDALDDGNVSNLETAFARTLQGGKFKYAVATGTANAWAVAPTPALAAYAAGRVLWVKAPATNTATTVTVNISGLGTRPLKKGDATDPAIGDLISGRWYPTIDDGTNVCVVSTLPSEVNSITQRLAQPYLGFHGDPVSQAFTTGTQSRITSYTSVTNNLPGASQSSGVITIGTTGFYAVTANMAALMPNPVSNYGYVISVSKVDGSNNPISSIAALPVSASTAIVPGSLAGAASGIAKLTAGDKIAAFFQHNQGSTQNMSISLDVEFRGA